MQLNIAAEEDFKKTCSSNNCVNLNKYLAEMYAFRVKYDIYKEELGK